MAEGHVWQGVCRVGSIHSRRACISGGLHGRGRGIRGREGMHGKGGMWGAYMAGETATEAGGTHPTGMHSC